MAKLASKSLKWVFVLPVVLVLVLMGYLPGKTPMPVAAYENNSALFPSFVRATPELPNVVLSAMMSKAVSIFGTNWSDAYYYNIYYVGSNASYAYPRFVIKLYSKTTSTYRLLCSSTTGICLAPASYQVKGNYNYKYEFKADGSLSNGGIYVMGYAGTEPFVNYYSSLPMVDVYNLWPNLINPMGYNPNSYGQVQLSDVVLGKIRDVKMADAGTISDTNLNKMINSIYSKFESDSLDKYFYIIRPKFDSVGVKKYYEFTLVHKSNTYTNFNYNHWFYTDADANLAFEYLELKVQGTNTFPVHIFNFDLNFDYLAYLKEPDLIYNIPMMDVPVNYTNLSVVTQQGLDGYMYIDTSDTMLTRIGAKKLPLNSDTLYVGLPDINIGNAGLTIPDDILIKMFTTIGVEQPNWQKLYNLHYVVFDRYGKYQIYLSNIKSGHFLASVVNPERDFLGNLVQKNTRVYAWDFYYKYSGTTYTMEYESLFQFSFDYSGNLVSQLKIIDDTWLDISNTIYYSNFTCATYGKKTFFSGIVGSPERDCALYGVKPLPGSVLVSGVLPGNVGNINDNVEDIINDMKEDAINNPVSDNTTLNGLFMNVILIFTTFANTPKLITDLLTALPPGISELVGIALSIFSFLALYKMYRMVRGLLF